MTSIIISKYTTSSSSSSIVLIFIIFFVLICHATSISFNFTSFHTGMQEIKCEGNASIYESVIHLTENKLFQTGHATYFQQMHLWDGPSGALADLITNFTYSINKENNSHNADGFAFFLGSHNYTMPEIQQGSGLGLASGTRLLDSKENPFVAVEFDTFFENEWDYVKGLHVGIDINSLNSSRIALWKGRVDGWKFNAGISYYSSSKNLCVYFTDVLFENAISPQELCHEVDLMNYLSESVVFGFSAATGSLSESHTIHSWSFSSTLKTQKKVGKQMAGWVLGLLVSGSVLILVAASLCWIWLCRYKKENTEQHEQEFNEFKKLLTGAKDISHDVLACATNNFDDKQKLGEGGFGAVYKGFLKDMNIYVAVKRISSGSSQGMSEYAAEVTIISQLRHRNLVQLIGWCHEKKDLLIVYEYMPNGSLEYHLFSSESLLNWGQRYKIAQGLASALEYLHQGWRNCVLHRDIKSSNVMLDSEFNPMLGDFGLARLVDHDKARSQTLLGGSYGYMAPECLETGKSSKESDVFSFGVVALEIACGKKPFVHKADESQVHIAKWVWELYENDELFEAVDQKLQGDLIEEQMECLLIIGLWCAQPDFSLRPSMREVVNVLNFDVPLPELPSKAPNLIIHSPPTQISSALSSINSTRGKAVTRNPILVPPTGYGKFTMSSTAPLLNNL